MSKTVPAPVIKTVLMVVSSASFDSLSNPPRRAVVSGAIADFASGRTAIGLPLVETRRRRRGADLGSAQSLDSPAKAEHRAKLTLVAALGAAQLLGPRRTHLRNLIRPHSLLGYRRPAPTRSFWSSTDERPHNRGGIRPSSDWSAACFPTLKEPVQARIRTNAVTN